jgi:aryl-alcohol dehydrogenase-like predicted oxidoreductase
MIGQFQDFCVRKTERWGGVATLAQVHTRQLGKSDLQITPLGIGAWAIGGGGWAFGWGAQDDGDSVAAIHAALDEGWNWIDTAAVYGLGHSEKVVAKALDGMSEPPLVFTKCGLVWNDQGEITRSLKRDSIRRECEASLRRLNVECIDLYQIHWPDPDAEVEEGWETMLRLKEEGKARWIGVSNFSASQLKRAEAIAPVASLQPPYNIITPGIEDEVLPYCRANGVGTIVYSPMKSGMLTGTMTRERIAAMPEDDYRQRTPNFKEPLLTRNLNLVEVLRQIGIRHGRTPGEVAIAWTLRHPAVTAAIVGLRNPEQLKGVRAASTFRLTAPEVAEIQNFLVANPV